MNFFLKPRRPSDLVIAVCLPILFFLCIQFNVLSKDLRAVSNGSTTFEEDKESLSDLQPNHLKFVDFKSKKTIEPPLNNTAKSRQDLLLLTPIFRAGSTLIRNLLNALKSSNNFILIAPTPKDEHVIHIPKEERQKVVASKVSSVNQTAVIIDSFAFINFAKFGYQQPIQVSMIRDPVETAISSYYLKRAPYHVVERIRMFPDTQLPSRHFLRKSLETCITTPKDPECSKYNKNEEFFGHTVEYFCGHDNYCKLLGNEDGLQQAKEVVEKSFAVVGVLEEWQKTMLVLQNYIPRFFNGTNKLLLNETYFEKFNRNIYKPKVEQWVKDVLKNKLTVEYDFYNYILQRLHRQYKAVFQ